MKHTILFVTSNETKFAEVSRWVAELEPNILLKQSEIDLPEIQSLEVTEVAIHKAQSAWRVLQQPLLIDDGGMYLDAYNKFPGTLSKYVYQGIGLEGVWKLAQSDTRAHMASCLAYIDNQSQFHVFEGRVPGHVVAPPEKHIPHMPFFSLFVPNGSNKLLIDIRGASEEKMYHHRYKAVSAFIQWWKTR